jgi:metal-sulfur cluster biosynthetic enzyme
VKIDGDDILVRLCEPGELKRTPKPSALPPLPQGQPEAGKAPSPSAQAAAIIEQALNPAAVEGKESAPAAANEGSSAPPAGPRELSEDLVREELKKVIDPELFINIVDLGLIYNVDLIPAEEGKTNCKIDMTMTSPMCPAGPQMIANSKQVLGQIEGMGNVEVKIVLDPPWTPDRMTDEARDQLGIF